MRSYFVRKIIHFCFFLIIPTVFNLLSISENQTKNVMFEFAGKINYVEKLLDGKNKITYIMVKIFMIIINEISLRKQLSYVKYKCNKL